MAWDSHGTGHRAGMGAFSDQNAYGGDVYGGDAGMNPPAGLYTHALPSGGGGFDMGAGSPSPPRRQPMGAYGGGDVYGFDLDGAGPSSKASKPKPSAALRASKRDETLAMAAQILGHKSVNIPQAAGSRRKKATQASQRRQYAADSDSDLSLSASASASESQIGLSRGESERERKRRERAAALDRRFSGKQLLSGGPSQSRDSIQEDEALEFDVVSDHDMDFNDEDDDESEGVAVHNTADSQWGLGKHRSGADIPDGLDSGPAMVMGGGTEAETSVEFDLEGTEDLDETGAEAMVGRLARQHAHGSLSPSAAASAAVMSASSPSPASPEPGFRLERSLASEVTDSDDDDEDAQATLQRDPKAWPQLPMDEPVEVLYAARNGGTQWYKAKLQERHSDGTYHVKYHDGDVEDGVTPWDIRPAQETEAGASETQAEKPGKVSTAESHGNRLSGWTAASSAAPMRGGLRTDSFISAVPSEIAEEEDEDDEDDDTRRDQATRVSLQLPQHGFVESGPNAHGSDHRPDLSPRLGQRSMSAYSVDFEDDAPNSGGSPWGATATATAAATGNSNRSPTAAAAVPVPGSAGVKNTSVGAPRLPSRSLTLSQASVGAYSMDGFETADDMDTTADGEPATRQFPTVRAAQSSASASTAIGQQQSLAGGTRIIIGRSSTTTTKKHMSDAGTQTEDIGTQTEHIAGTRPPAWGASSWPAPAPHFQQQHHPFSAGLGQSPWGAALASGMQRPTGGLWPMGPFGMSPAGSAAYLRALAQAVAEKSASGGAPVGPSSAAGGLPRSALSHTAVFQRQLQILRGQMESIKQARISSAASFARVPVAACAAPPQAPE